MNIATRRAVGITSASPEPQSHRYGRRRGTNGGNKNVLNPKEPYTARVQIRRQKRLPHLQRRERSMSQQKGGREVGSTWVSRLPMSASPAMAAPEPRAWRRPHNLPSPILRTANGCRELLPPAGDDNLGPRRHPLHCLPPTATAPLPARHLRSRFHPTRTCPKPLPPLRPPVHTHSIPTPSGDQTHSRTHRLASTRDGVRSTQWTTPKAGEELPGRTAVRQSLWMALIAHRWMFHPLHPLCASERWYTPAFGKQLYGVPCHGFRQEPLCDNF